MLVMWCKRGNDHLYNKRNAENLRKEYKTRHDWTKNYAKN